AAGGTHKFRIGPGGASICQNGKCHKAGGQTIENLVSANYQPMSQSQVAAIRRLNGVAAAIGGLTPSDTRVKIPKNFCGPSRRPPPPHTFKVNRGETSPPSLGPPRPRRINPLRPPPDPRA